MNVQNPMIVQSAHYRCDSFEIKATVNKHADFIPKILAAHVNCGNDNVCSSLKVGKKKAIKSAKKNTFQKMGYVESTVEKIMAESTKFLIDAYGYSSAQSMTECRQRLWARRTGRNGRTPKLFYHG